jgi:hypothetical protein
MKRYAGGCIGLATVLPALGYAGSGRWVGAMLAVALGCVWLIGLYRGWPGTEALGLAGFVGIAAAGTTVAAPLLLASVVAALAAWDLHRFALRLDRAGREQVLHEPALIRSHIRWSLGVAGVGLLVSLAAPAIQMVLPFGAAILLSALALFGVSRAIRWLNRAS